MPVVPLLHLLTILIAGLVSLAWALAGWLLAAWGAVGGLVGPGGGPGGGAGTTTAITASAEAIVAEAADGSGATFGARPGATLPRPIAAAGWAIEQLQVVVATSDDPRRVDPAFAPEALDLVIHDARRDRDIPVLIQLPATHARAPVVLFSHGLGGSRHGGRSLARHSAARGNVAVFLQHPGSDASVWTSACRECS